MNKPETRNQKPETRTERRDDFFFWFLVSGFWFTPAGVAR
jgi:hypothetical protein